MGPPPHPNKPPSTTTMGMPRRQSTVGSVALSRTGSNSSSASNSTSRPPQANRLSLKPAGLSALGVVGKRSSVSTSSERSSPEGGSTAAAGGALRRTRNDNDPRVSPGPGRRASVMGKPGGASPARIGAAGQPLSPATPGPAPAANPGAMAALSRELEDLKSTIKVMEKKRVEDRDKLRLLERAQAERDKFEIIIQKLQGPIHIPLQHHL